MAQKVEVWIFEAKEGRKPVWVADFRDGGGRPYFSKNTDLKSLLDSMVTLRYGPDVELIVHWPEEAAA